MHPVKSWSDSVDGPGFGSACAPINSWSASDIVDDAGLDGSSGIHGSGWLTSVHPWLGPDGGELDDGRAADSSGSAK
jgi:hypothetical protein